MDIKELTTLSPADRAKALAHARETLRRLRFEAAQGTLTKVRDLREARKTVARLLTLVSKDTRAAAR